MTQARGAARALLQDLYLQDLSLSIYDVYSRRAKDAAGAAILRAYLRAETTRGARIESRLEAIGSRAAPAVRALFRGAGRIYGAATAKLGTRVTLRIALSTARRAARRTCAGLGREVGPDLLHLATLKARNEGDLVDALTRHLIDTRRRDAGAPPGREGSGAPPEREGSGAPPGRDPD